MCAPTSAATCCARSSASTGADPREPPGRPGVQRSGNLCGGGVSERPKEHASKACDGASRPWVQIPPPPPARSATGPARPATVPVPAGGRPRGCLRPRSGPGRVAPGSFGTPAAGKSCSREYRRPAGGAGGGGRSPDERQADLDARLPRMDGQPHGERDPPLYGTWPTSPTPWPTAGTGTPMSGTCSRRTAPRPGTTRHPAHARDVTRRAAEEAGTGPDDLGWSGTGGARPRHRHRWPGRTQPSTGAAPAVAPDSSRPDLAVAPGRPGLWCSAPPPDRPTD